MNKQILTIKLIAKKYGISEIKAEQIYRRMKMKQVRLYADEIEGREEWKNVRAISARKNCVRALPEQNKNAVNSLKIKAYSVLASVAKRI